ncbi:MAG: hypothetical protein U0796_13070 [Gemmatales bacterium]
MKAGVCFLLIFTQVLVSTLGQGALSLCVRTDGAQKVQWTFAKACGKKVADPKVCSCCGAKKEIDSNCPGTSSNTNVKNKCHSCEDYIIVADYESIPGAAHHQFMDEFSNLPMIVGFELVVQSAPGQTASEFDRAQAHLPNILSTIVSTVVIRC